MYQKAFKIINFIILIKETFRLKLKKRKSYMLAKKSK